MIVINGSRSTIDRFRARAPGSGRAAAQREAMSRLAMMDGVWKGSAWTLLPSGEKHSITQA